MHVMNIRKFGAALIAVLACVAAGAAHAQATRTWVSGVGDDVNPCSRTAPCKTFAGAISKTAAGGEISVLDPGGFGTVTITKAITIDGGGGQVASILASLTTGIIVNAGVNDVVRIRNVTINGAGNGINGIRFIAGAALEVHNVQIHGFTGQGISFEVPSLATSALTVTDSRLENNTGGAILATGAGTPVVALERVVMIGGQRGLRAEDGAIVHVTQSEAMNHSGNGFIANGTLRAVQMTLDRCVSFHNGAAGVFSGTLSNVFLSGSSITNNGTGLALSGGGIVSSGNNTVQGNGVNGSPTSTPGTI
jgi:parallel beta helix pectate lyase-like protein